MLPTPLTPIVNFTVSPGQVSIEYGPVSVPPVNVVEEIPCVLTAVYGGEQNGGPNITISISRMVEPINRPFLYSSTLTEITPTWACWGLKSICPVWLLNEMAVVVLSG